MIIDPDSSTRYFELNEWKKDDELKRLMTECIALQKKCAEQHYKSKFRPVPNADKDVSEQKLNHILSKGLDIHGIATEEKISNVIVFNSTNMTESVTSEELKVARRKIDQHIFNKVKALFDTQKQMHLIQSGHLWYPQGGYMGWHTNSGVPGWRLYINYAEESGKSFFRYCHPESKKIVTVHDEKWNFRIFKITKEDAFWHAVYSQTNRFSLGYLISFSQKSFLSLIKKVFRK